MSRRYRYRRRSRLLRRLRRAFRRMSGGQKAALAVAAVVVLAGAGHGAAASRSHQPAAPASAVATVVGYAKAQLGAPYVWGGTGPYAAGFDCSGLVMMAFRPAGITFGSSRPTAAVEWAWGPQVSAPERGDLVFFAGADGTPAAPGHVGIVVSPSRHLMIDAYATGVPVEYDTYGLPTSAPGLSDPVGFTDPFAHAGVS